MTARALMVCGTASDVGKSHLVTGLCRALRRRGLAVAPFKGQNMALNSVVTADGAEIGRAQGTQAQAAGVAPEAAMNPVLLKPADDRRSQVVVLGRPWRTLDAASFQRAKAELEPIVLGALADLRSRVEVVVCEGAGSPAETNLFDHDLVNLGLAAKAGVPAVVVGDIDRGGVFAHLYGTVALLPPERRVLVRGFVINKFRGDPALLGDASEDLRRRCGVPTLGVVPWLPGLWLDAEDSLALESGPWRAADHGGLRPAYDDGDAVALDVAVVRLPRIANFTDLDPLAAEPQVSLRLVDRPGLLGDPDLVILPGTKATMADLDWLRDRGLDVALRGCRAAGTVVVGLCGGYQMLGHAIEDRAGVESATPVTGGLGLLGLRTVFGAAKRTARRRGTEQSSGERVEGYEIHHGVPEPDGTTPPWFAVGPACAATGTGAATGAARDASRDGPPLGEPEGLADERAGVFGTSLHGVFESDGFRARFLGAVAARRDKAWRPGTVPFAARREAQIDRLADAVETHLDVDALLALASDSTSGMPAAGARPT